MKDDFRDRSHLTAIAGSRPEDKPRAGRRRAIGDDEQVTCFQCLADIGVETSGTVEMTLAPRRSPEGKLSGGTKAHVCAYCLMRGKITRLVG